MFHRIRAMYLIGCGRSEGRRSFTNGSWWAAAILIAVIVLIPHGVHAQPSGLVCLTQGPDTLSVGKTGGPTALGDCDYLGTSQDIGDYVSQNERVIPVVVHAIDSSSGAAFLPEATIAAAIDHLNAAFAGDHCSEVPGCLDSGIRFTWQLNRVVDDSLYQWRFCSAQDVLNLVEQTITPLQWDPLRFLNIFIVDLVNTCSEEFPEGLGFPPWYETTAYDGVVIDFQAIEGTIPERFQGDALVHQVGHYLGLFHTFDGGCATPQAPDCYANGDFICDTNPESGPRTENCTSASFWTCDDPGLPDNLDNFMNVHMDVCRKRFTFEQVGRMRCVLESWRAALGQEPGFDAAGIPGTEDGLARGIAWSSLYGSSVEKDFLYVSRYGLPNIVLEVAEGALQQKTDPNLEDDGRGWGVAAGDLNNDATTDLVVGNVGFGSNPLADDVLALSTASGGYKREAPFDPLGSESNGLAMADVNGDGHLDLAVAGFPSTRIYLGDGSGALMENTPPVFTSLGPTLAVCFVDYDDDGDQDLCVSQGLGGDTHLFRNDSGALVYDQSFSAYGTSSAAWGDYDNDGDLDVYLVTNIYGSWNVFFENLGGGEFSYGTGGSVVNWSYADFSEAAWFDHDNDGDLDLYLASATRNYLLENEGDGVFDDATTLFDFGPSPSIACADWDADGDVDLAISRDVGESVLLENLLDPQPGGMENYLVVRLAGSVPNASAIGAKVVCSGLTGGGLFRRDVVAGKGIGSQDSGALHFGLGAESAVDISVTWPSGEQTIRANVSANQAVVIHEHAFANTSASVGISTGDTMIVSASVSLDYNGDDKLDLLVGIEGNFAQLFTNATSGEQDSKFADDLPAAFKGQVRPWATRGFAVADINNDGRPGFFSAAATTPSIFLSHVPTGPEPWFFYDASAYTVIGVQGTDSWSGAWGDYDADGWVDLYICRADGVATPTGIVPMRDTLLRSKGLKYAGTDSVFVDFLDITTAGDLCSFDTAPTSASWADFDGDGDLDLVVGSLAQAEWDPGKKTDLYLNDGAGEFSMGTDSLGLGSVGYVSGVLWADLDRDADLDLILSRQNPYLPGSQVGLMFVRNDGSGNFSWWTPFDVSPDHPMTGVQIADVDLDGWLDVMAIPEESSAWPLFYRNDLGGTGGFVDQVQSSGWTVGSAKGFAVADFNADGDPDVYLGRPETNSEFFFENRLNDQGQNAYVQLRLRSESGGNNGIGLGSEVEISLDGTTQKLMVDGGSGGNGQQPGILTFGLGDYTGSTVDVTVTWPDGYVTNETGVAVNGLFPIEDDHDPGLLDGTVGFVPVTRPGGLVDWYFNWRTTLSSAKSLDLVEIQAPIARILLPSQAGVEHTYLRIGNTYFHQMILRNQACVPKTQVKYRVGSSVATPGRSVEWSSFKTYKLGICVQ